MLGYEVGNYLWMGAGDNHIRCWASNGMPGIPDQLHAGQAPYLLYYHWMYCTKLKFSSVILSWQYSLPIVVMAGLDFSVPHRITFQDSHGNNVGFTSGKKRWPLNCYHNSGVLTSAGYFALPTVPQCGQLHVTWLGSEHILDKALTCLLRHRSHGEETGVLSIK